MERNVATNMNDDLLKDLRALMRIPSISAEAEGEYPYGKPVYEALKYVMDLCGSFGFRTKYVGNHMGYAEIGSGEEMVGILTHLDVVPAGSGWDVEPFDLTLKDGKLYGRGISDDKGPAMMMIYAAKALLESGRPLEKRYRLIFGCTEETGVWTDIEKYKREEEMPAYGFTPDSDFPVVFAEKGILQVWLSVDKKGSGIAEARGGEAENIVPDHCEILTETDGRHIEGFGKSVHGSTPWDGENAISDAMSRCKGRFAEMYNKCIGKDWTGAGLGIDFKDELSGKTTVNVGMIETTDEKIRLSLDIRYPVTYTRKDILDALAQVTGEYGAEITVSAVADPSIIDPETPFIKKLMDVYRSATGDCSEPIVQGGGTYSKAMPGIVAFGPLFPGSEATEHQANEYVSVDDFERAYSIYVETLEVI